MNKVNNNTDNEAKKRRSKKLFLLFLVCGITVMLLAAATYAWFVGISKVKVNNFTVNIKSSRTLDISLDGYTWSDNITVNENTIKGHNESGLAYNNNKNSWVGEDGLVPVSSSGDNYEGILDIYSKSSMTGTNGGYRLTGDMLDNYEEELPYYVAFDIFLKNSSGDTYNPVYNLLDDENIYMTYDSYVYSTSMLGTTNYGIQNSARVAFVQVGRISIDDLEDYTTPDIRCTYPTEADKYTTLCDATGNMYSTVIWEPNEFEHSDELLEYYDKVCNKKYATADGVDYYDSACKSLTYYTRTNTIKRTIKASDNVDIYDGLNNYTDTIQSEMHTTIKPLQATGTFTDSMKETEGDYTLFRLAPHSVTKIRVYVYLEGQDVDNYDLVTKDQDIVVSFGFTKERISTNEMQDNIDFTSISSNPSTLYNTIKSSSLGSSKDINFDISSTSSGTNGVYQLDEDKAVYFYRGQVDNNVIFNGMCWKIIRTTNTGGVKLLYNGVASAGTCNTASGYTIIGASNFNTYTYTKPDSTVFATNITTFAKMGYTYNFQNAIDLEVVEDYMPSDMYVDYNSNIKTQIDGWYNTYMSGVGSYLEDTPYCNDRRLVSYTSSKMGAYIYEGYYLASSLRSSPLTIGVKPTLSCANNDAYTMSGNKGNGILSKPVGLLTSDEVILAGYTSQFISGSETMADKDNTNSYLNNSSVYWTMTPNYFGGSDNAHMAVVSSGKLQSKLISQTAGIRPVISLKNGLLVSSGSGTTSSPYIIATD